jgi:hypothetical protein
MKEMPTENNGLLCIMNLFFRIFAIGNYIPFNIINRRHLDPNSLCASRVDCSGHTCLARDRREGISNLFSYIPLLWAVLWFKRKKWRLSLKRPGLSIQPKPGFEPRTVYIIKSLMQASMTVRIKLLYITTAWVQRTSLMACTECPNQALNWGLQKNGLMSFESLLVQATYAACHSSICKCVWIYSVYTYILVSIVFWITFYTTVECYVPLYCENSACYGEPEFESAGWTLTEPFIGSQGPSFESNHTASHSCQYTHRIKEIVTLFMLRKR